MAVQNAGFTIPVRTPTKTPDTTTPAQVQQPFSTPIQTHLTGVGHVSHKPDCGILVFEIAHRDFKEKGAEPSVLDSARQDVLRDALATVQKFFKWHEDYNEDQITHFSINELGASSRIQSGQRVFEAKTMVKVTFGAVDNFEALRKFAKEAILHNGVTVTSIDWRLSDENREVVHRAARKVAMLNARSIACEHAKELYNLEYSLDEMKPTWSDERPYYTYTAIDCGRSATSASGGKVVYFVPENVQVTVNVSCKFEFDLGKARAAVPTANACSPNTDSKANNGFRFSPSVDPSPKRRKSIKAGNGNGR
ncbi:hypothetical protein E6O75_ATG04530 [Venturia nashicola]|uniref:Uncharacterized protein n=1 Tax=Venturia nashicola TaxID=86259 RepID=A0A4Z1P9Z9_9PEZI|nr:hypothetical protein E6O75_ATG04530 [Venturia nashicola]